MIMLALDEAEAEKLFRALRADPQFSNLKGNEVLDYPTFAALIGVEVITLRGYLRDSRANRKAGKHLIGDVPEPDFSIGGVPMWYVRTVQKFIRERPGRGGVKVGEDE